MVFPKDVFIEWPYYEPSSLNTVSEESFSIIAADVWKENIATQNLVK